MYDIREIYKSYMNIKYYSRGSEIIVVDQQNDKRNKQLPITHSKDIEFSLDVADDDDFEALERAKSAKQRNEIKK